MTQISANARWDRVLTLSDGRTLAFTDVGDPLGYPIVFGHGMPGSRLEGRFFDKKAREHGFRILTPDRPGIGNSDFQPGRKLLDYPADIEQLADSLELARFSHIGWSSGGSRTLACCYRLADRVDLGVCLSGPTTGQAQSPIDATGRHIDCLAIQASPGVVSQRCRGNGQQARPPALAGAIERGRIPA